MLSRDNSSPCSSIRLSASSGRNILFRQFRNFGADNWTMEARAELDVASLVKRDFAREGE